MEAKSPLVLKWSRALFRKVKKVSLIILMPSGSKRVFLVIQVIINHPPLTLGRGVQHHWVKNKQTIPYQYLFEDLPKGRVK